MNTPDLTLEDLAGGAGGLGILAYTSNSENEWVQLAGVIFAGLTGLAIVICGTLRRGNRAKNISDTTVWLDTGDAGEIE